MTDRLEFSAHQVRQQLGFVLAREWMADVILEIEPLLQKHWAEIAHYRDIALEPDWDRYAQLNVAGKLRIYTARVWGQLVGYAIFMVDHAPHYKASLQAVQDILWLAPEHRGRMLGARLISFADANLKGEGVQVVYQHVKCRPGLDFGPILERLGYERVDTVWARRLDGG